MKRSLLCIFLVAVAALITSTGMTQEPAAQQLTGSITGAVKDMNAQKLHAATIYLNRATDSVLVKTTIADSGRFQFTNIPAGTYRITVTNVGFRKHVSEPFTITPEQPALVLPEITMIQADRNTLQDVTVFGRKPFIEQKIDRTVVSVDQMISAAGTNAFELLEKLPGVGIDFDGNVSLKGKSGALVFVNNKPTLLSAADLAGYLKSIPSGTLDKVELISNPPARYDASGTGGIINIILKKNTQEGFNGSTNISYGQGMYEKLNASVNTNYRVNKLNFYANVGASESKDFERSRKTRAYRGPGETVTSRFLQEGFSRFDKTSFSGRVGLDYLHSKNTTWGIVLNGSIRPSADLGGNTTFLQGKNFELDSSVIFRNNSDNEWRNGGVNVNMLHKFRKAGNEVSFDADYATYKTVSDQVFDYLYYDGGNSFKDQNSLLGYLPRNIDIYSARLDYQLPLNNGIHLETGLRSSFVNTDNRADYFIRDNGITTPDYENTNTFRYDENINAAYISANKSITRRLEIKAGLRVEQTLAKGHQLGNAIKPDSSFKRDYVNLFPTAFIAYKFDSVDKHQVVLSYGKRINRPSYQSLNPFLSFVDRYYQEAGNPFLNPQVSQVLEVTYTYNRFLNASVFYDYVENTFNRVMELSGTNTFINRPANIGKITNLGVLVTADINPAKIWNLFLYNEVGRKSVKSVFNGINVDTAIYFYSFQFRNSFTLKKGWSMELNGFIASRDFTGQFVVRPQGELSAAIQKRFKRSSLTISARDILYTRISRGTILNIPDVDATFDNRRDSRVITASFNYRFGKVNNRGRNRRSSAEEEQNRVN
jgi:hypothetical protein